MWCGNIPFTLDLRATGSYRNTKENGARHQTIANSLMKYLIYTLVLFCSCTIPKSNKEIFEEFHNAYETSDISKLENLLTEDFELVQYNKINSYKHSYLEFLSNWDKTFNTKWNVVSIKESGQLIESVEYDSDLFNDYFWGGKMPLKYTYYFKGNKISKLHVDTLPGSTERIIEFNNKYATFHEWVLTKYPEKSECFSAKDEHAIIELKKLLDEYITQRR